MTSYDTPGQWYDTVVTVWKSGRHDDAITQMQELHAAHPRESLPCAALAAWYKKTARMDEAITFAEKYCELEPEDPFGFSILSAYCLEAGRRNEAEDALMKASNLRVAAQLKAHRERTENAADDDEG